MTVWTTDLPKYAKCYKKEIKYGILLAYKYKQIEEEEYSHESYEIHNDLYEYSSYGSRM